MKPFPRVDGSLRSAAPFSVQDLAERFGTPLFLYSFDFIRGRFGLLREAFLRGERPPGLLREGQREPGAAEPAGRAGGWGRYRERGRTVQGPESWGSPRAGSSSLVWGRPTMSFRAGLDARIYAFNVETTGELHRLESLARERGGQGPLRDPDQSRTSTPRHPTSTPGPDTPAAKFGLPVPVAVGLLPLGGHPAQPPDQGNRCPHRLPDRGARPLQKGPAEVLEVVHLLKKDGIHLEYVDMGGGFGIPDEAETEWTFPPSVTLSFPSSEDPAFV